MNETPLLEGPSSAQRLEEAEARSRELQDELHADEKFDQLVQQRSRQFVDASGKEPLKRLSADVATIGALTAGAVLIAGGGVNALDAQIQNDHERNQQLVEESQQNERQEQFQQGLDANKVTIELPTTDEAELPSPDTH